MKITITGSGTAIGNVIAKKLLTHGHKVTCIYNSNFPKNLKKFKNFQSKKINLKKKFNINLNAEILIHCASATPERNNAIDFRKVNVIGFNNLLKSLNRKILKKIILISSIAVYEKNNQKIIAENTFPRYKSKYAKSKIDQENLLKKFNAKGIKKTILRLSSILFKDCKVNFYCKSLSNIKKNKKIFIFGKNKLVNSVFYLDDLATLATYLVSVNQKRKNSIYNIVSKKPIKMEQILDQFYLKLKKNKNYVIFPSKEKNYIFSTRKLSRLKFNIPTVDNTINKFLKNY